MSRVAKAPIHLPSNVSIQVQKDSVIVKGPKGELDKHLNRHVSIKQSAEDASVYIFEPATDDVKAWAQAGTARALVNNMIKGVTEGFSITLEMVGVGYRAQANPKTLALSLGFSHPVEYALPAGIIAETPNNTTIVLRGIDKQLLGQAASEIRSYRPPEPYNGKGIKYAGEQIVRKEAKKK